jgi:hypothetical protein
MTDLNKVLVGEAADIISQGAENSDIFESMKALNDRYGGMTASTTHTTLSSMVKLNHDPKKSVVPHFTKIENYANEGLPDQLTRADMKIFAADLTLSEEYSEIWNGELEKAPAGEDREETYARLKKEIVAKDQHRKNREAARASDEVNVFNTERERERDNGKRDNDYVTRDDMKDMFSQFGTSLVNAIQGGKGSRSSRKGKGKDQDDEDPPVFCRICKKTHKGGNSNKCRYNPYNPQCLLSKEEKKKKIEEFAKSKKETGKAF